MTNLQEFCTVRFKRKHIFPIIGVLSWIRKVLFYEWSCVHKEKFHIICTKKNRILTR